MFNTVKRILTLIISAVFIIVGSIGLLPDSAEVYADVGSISDGEDVSYDKTAACSAAWGLTRQKCRKRMILTRQQILTDRMSGSAFFHRIHPQRMPWNNSKAFIMLLLNRKMKI